MERDDNYRCQRIRELEKEVVNLKNRKLWDIFREYNKTKKRWRASSYGSRIDWGKYVYYAIATAISFGLGIAGFKLVLWCSHTHIR